jgi:hypothetical protein
VESLHVSEVIPARQPLLLQVDQLPGCYLGE